LAGEDAAAAGRAIWRLVTAGDQAVSLLKERLRPAPPFDAKRVARLLGDLDNGQFAVRERAMADLEEFEERAEDQLRAALRRRPSPEARRRVEELLGQLKETSPRRLRKLRAVEALEYLGTPAARQVLNRLAGGAPQA